MQRYFRKIKASFEASKPEETVKFAAVLGNTSGVVSTGISGIVYATKFNGEVIRVINRRVPNEAFKHVVIGYDPSYPGVLQVLRERTVFSTQDARVPAVPEHDHTYNSGMAHFVYDLTIIPFLVLPYSGFTVQIFGGVFLKSDGSFGLLDNQTLDLSSYQPVSGAIWVTLEFDDDGDINVFESSAVNDKSLLTIANIYPASNYPLVAIQMYYDQTELQRDPEGTNDFFDLRFGGSTLIDADNVTYTPDDLNDWNCLADPGNVAEALDQLADNAKSLRYRRHVIVQESGGGWSFVTLDNEPVMVLDELE